MTEHLVPGPPDDVGRCGDTTARTRSEPTTALARSPGFGRTAGHHDAHHGTRTMSIRVPGRWSRRVATGSCHPEQPAPAKGRQGRRGERRPTTNRSAVSPTGISGIRQPTRTVEHPHGPTIGSTRHGDRTTSGDPHGEGVPHRPRRLAVSSRSVTIDRSCASATAPTSTPASPTMRCVEISVDGWHLRCARSAARRARTAHSHRCPVDRHSLLSASAVSDVGTRHLPSVRRRRESMNDHPVGRDRERARIRTRHDRITRKRDVHRRSGGGRQAIRWCLRRDTPAITEVGARFAGESILDVDVDAIRLAIAGDPWIAPSISSSTTDGEPIHTRSGPPTRRRGERTDVTDPEQAPASGRLRSSRPDRRWTTGGDRRPCRRT